MFLYFVNYLHIRFFRRPCWFVYISSSGEEIWFCDSRFWVRDCLASVWLPFGFILFGIWPLIYHKEKIWLVFVVVLITQLAYLSLCKSISTFRRATQIILCSLFNVVFSLCLAFITRHRLTDWLLIYLNVDAIIFVDVCFCSAWLISDFTNFIFLWYGKFIARQKTNKILAFKSLLDFNLSSFGLCF